jgi:asparagine synthase (glutamine-hydrolysing)
MVERWSGLNRFPLLGRIFCGLYSSLITPYTSANPKYAGVLSYGGSFHGAYMIERGVVKPWELTQVLNREFAEEGMKRLGDELGETFVPSVSDFANVSILESSRYMRNQLLRDSDWAGMAHSLEIRVPLVDSVVIEKLAGLAAAGRFQYSKAVLPRTLRNGLPPAVASRPKTGFTVPLWQWLRKSPAIGEWKRVKFLRRPNVHDYSRWAYTLLASDPHTAGLLRV